MNKLRDEELNAYLAAGCAVRRSLEEVITLVKPGIKLVDICEEAERVIVKYGAKPAFPCNIAVNDVAAHFSPIYADPDEVPPGSVIKVDVGAHVDGYIADAAITVSLDRRFDNLVNAVREALTEAINVFKPGVKLSQVGAVIEKAITKWGGKPVTNLSGHLIKRFSLHAGKSVPNISRGTHERIRLGEVYAIEPFATTRSGAGYVIEGERTRIFRLVRPKEPKEEELVDLFREIRKRFLTLPFSPRWLSDHDSEDVILKKLQKLERLGYLMSYPVLRDKYGAPIAQWEETVVVGERPLVVTR